MKLYAISDLHLRHPLNREIVDSIPAHPRDWLAVAGDVSERDEDHEWLLRRLRPRFAGLIWTPGNHDLWSRSRSRGPHGEERYRELVELYRSHGALTPEDPFLEWDGAGERCVVAPVFCLYDYTFRPPHVPEARAVEWAVESGVLCTDEILLRPHPHASKAAWCRERVCITEARLAEAARRHPLVLISHFPLRWELAETRRIPRFRIWCGTELTRDWHRRFRARVVVSGHVHVPGTRWLDGVRFEEVSLGYPREFRRRPGPRLLREILPATGASSRDGRSWWVQSRIG